jgi:hypothetical protein
VPITDFIVEFAAIVLLVALGIAVFNFEAGQSHKSEGFKSSKLQFCGYACLLVVVALPFLNICLANNPSARLEPAGLAAGALFRCVLGNNLRHHRIWLWLLLRGQNLPRRNDGGGRCCYSQFLPS